MTVDDCAPAGQADRRFNAVASPPATIGRYEIVNRLAQGGMGALYLAWDPKLDRQIAIKLLMHDDDELRERFAREGRSAARLRHPHIVTIFDVGEHNNQPFIAMEYIQGQTLAELIRGRVPLPITRKLKLAEELCDGLSFAHKAGVVHRDIKPANAIVDAQGSLKILDFGIARFSEASGMTHAGMLIGTLNYMSPEQMTGRPADSRSDIFAVGAVCYELLSYRQAFPGGLEDGVLTKILQGQPEPLEKVCSDLDPEIVRIVERSLEKDPDKRYQDLIAMVRDLQRVRLRLDGLETHHVSTEETERPVTSTTTGGSSPRRTADREDLARRRASQTRVHLEAARQAFDDEDYDAASVRCEEALLLDADNAAAIELLDRVRAALDERQAGEWLTEAESQIRLGALSAAQALIDRALALDASSARATALQTAVEEALRGRERARQLAESIQRALDRTHVAFDRGLFDEAVAEADQALSLDPNLAQATALKSRAVEAIKERNREALERRARETVREAHRLFTSGSHTEALELLARFEPAHDLVSRSLAQLRAQSDRIGEERRLEAERRAKHARIGAELGRVRSEIERREFAVALAQLRRLEQSEGASPEIASLVREAEAGATNERDARAAREVAEHVASATTLFQKNDFDGALAKAESALALDPKHEIAQGLRTKIQQSRLAEADRRESEARRIRERDQSVASAIQEAKRAGSHEAAIRTLRSALEIHPQHVEVRELLERHQGALDRERAEQRRLQEAEQRRPQEAEQRRLQEIEQHRRADQSQQAQVPPTVPRATQYDPLASWPVEPSLSDFTAEEAKTRTIRDVPLPPPPAKPQRAIPAIERAMPVVGAVWRDWRFRPALLGLAAFVLLAVAFVSYWAFGRATAPRIDGPSPPPSQVSELESVRQSAQQQLAAGQVLPALETVSQGLKTSPDHDGLKQLLGEILRAAREQLDRAQQATRPGTGRTSTGLGEAEQQRQESVDRKSVV